MRGDHSFCSGTWVCGPFFFLIFFVDRSLDGECRHR